MEVGVASSYNGVMRSGDVGERSPGKGLHVNFCEKGEVKERREKFLTAKYGSHQMSLIRKRLAVEMWLYDELQKLYESAVSFVWSWLKLGERRVTSLLHDTAWPIQTWHL
ncbi:hypothetical protein AAG570_003961 [Ranatra chinensis]|uniref:Protein phosphatase 1 regulatory subunit 14C n=1 Tax=Ranatra chinensis TaxID=642074 RepID=A0ABD0Y2F0_9HEMI